MSSHWECQFGGGLQALPHAVAWGLLAGVAILGFGLIVILYRRTLRQLPPGKRRNLTALRAALLVAILICLANPSRVNDSDRKHDIRRRLAVVIDRSASMSISDNRSETRIGNALRIWKEHTGEALDNFDQVDYYRFSTGLDKAAGLEAAVDAKDPGPETHLYSSLNSVVDDGPDAVVCLTDGLDTTGSDAQELVDLAQRRGVPVYFVAGTNRTRPSETLSIREVSAPSRVLRHSRFTASVAIEVAAPKEGQIPVEVWSGNQKLASAMLPVRAGWNVLPWSVPLAAGEAGPMPLEFRAGEGANRQVAASTTQVVDKSTVDILYYQGALQWGYRFLLAALQSDPSFRVQSILNPSLHIQMSEVFQGEQPLHDLPDDAAALKNFHIIVLANVFADQLTAKQQKALVDYTKAGGSVLFITPDTEASAEFAGTFLEMLLPIIFETPQQKSPQNAAEQTFQEHMQEIGGSRPNEESVFAAEKIATRVMPGLAPFALPTGVAGSKLFQSGSNAPKFSTYAEVDKVKPGAEILAVHPTDHGADGNAQRVLIARQRFGEGWSAAMTTDLLWRWKMSVPSDSHVVENFWQQFMLSLAPPSRGQGLRLVKKTDSPAVSHDVTLRIEGSDGGAPKVVITSPTGVAKTLLPSQSTSDHGTDAWECSFIPDAEGRWEARATDAAGNDAHITLGVTQQVRTLETSNLPADVPGMRHIAESTGGSLIEDSSPAFHKIPPPDLALDARHARPLWNTPWLILLLLTLYCAELITRRVYRLL